MTARDGLDDGRRWLLAAAWMSVAASAIHVAAIVGGPDWYRFFGAGEELARAAERGSPVPAIMTLVIAAIIAAWAAFAFSAAGIIRRLPLVRTALLAIAFVLLARGALVVVPGVWAPELSMTFRVWSSAICLAMGLCFAVGTVRAWPRLSLKRSVA